MVTPKRMIISKARDFASQVELSAKGSVLIGSTDDGNQASVETRFSESQLGMLAPNTSEHAYIANRMRALIESERQYKSFSDNASARQYMDDFEKEKSYRDKTRSNVESEIDKILVGIYGEPK